MPKVARSVNVHEFRWFSFDIVDRSQLSIEIIDDKGDYLNDRVFRSKREAENFIENGFDDEFKIGLLRARELNYLRCGVATSIHDIYNVMSKIEVTKLGNDLYLVKASPEWAAVNATPWVLLRLHKKNVKLPRKLLEDWLKRTEKN